MEETSPQVKLTRYTPTMHRRPKMPESVKTYTDPLYPGTGTQLHLKAPDTPTSFAGADLAQEMIKKYVSPSQDQEKEYIPIQEEDGTWSNVPMTESLCFTVAGITVMQQGPDPNILYSFEELVLMSVTMPTLWRQVMEETNRLNTLVQGNLKNDSRAVSEQQPSLPPTTSTPSQNSSNGSTPSGTPSTPESGPSSINSEETVMALGPT